MPEQTLGLQQYLADYAHVLLPWSPDDKMSAEAIFYERLKPIPKAFQFDIPSWESFRTGISAAKNRNPWIVNPGRGYWYDASKADTPRPKQPSDSAVRGRSLLTDLVDDLVQEALTDPFLTIQ